MLDRSGAKKQPLIEETQLKYGLENIRNFANESCYSSSIGVDNSLFGIFKFKFLFENNDYQHLLDSPAGGEVDASGDSPLSNDSAST